MLVVPVVNHVLQDIRISAARHFAEEICRNGAATRTKAARRDFLSRTLRDL